MFGSNSLFLIRSFISIIFICSAILQNTFGVSLEFLDLILKLCLELDFGFLDFDLGQV